MTCHLSEDDTEESSLYVPSEFSLFQFGLLPDLIANSEENWDTGKSLVTATAHTATDFLNINLPMSNSYTLCVAHRLISLYYKAPTHCFLFLFANSSVASEGNMLLYSQ